MGTIRYRGGYRAEIRDQKVSRLLSSATATDLTTLKTITGCAAIVKPVRFPDEVTLGGQPRLKVWLRLAVGARPPASAADAIRNYYMIWEDMNPSTQPVAGSPDQELKFIRDFVSHGKPLNGAGVTTFLNREFGKPENHFDPHNQEHQNFLDGRRQWARNLVEAEIDKLL